MFFQRAKMYEIMSLELQAKVAELEKSCAASSAELKTLRELNRFMREELEKTRKSEEALKVLLLGERPTMTTSSKKFHGLEYEDIWAEDPAEVEKIHQDWESRGEGDL